MARLHIACGGFVVPPDIKPYNTLHIANITTSLLYSANAHVSTVFMISRVCWLAALREIYAFRRRAEAFMLHGHIYIHISFAGHVAKRKIAQRERKRVRESKESTRDV